MNVNGILHLTVDRHGHLRVWETAAEAVDNKEFHEVMVQISLNAAQIRLILKAEQMARERWHG